MLLLADVIVGYFPGDNLMILTVKQNGLMILELLVRTFLLTARNFDNCKE